MDDPHRKSSPAFEQQGSGWAKLGLAFLAVPVVVIATFALLVSGWVAYEMARSRLFPAASAKTFVPELNTSIEFELYSIMEDNDSGRYLTVSSPAGRFSGKISGFDWAHWSRTSLYMTEDHKIAVLGVSYSDHIVDPEKRTIDIMPPNVPSEAWTYLGAFDGGFNLRFIPASEQRECNPTAMSEHEVPPWAPRPQQWQEWCLQNDLRRGAR